MKRGDQEAHWRRGAGRVWGGMLGGADLSIWPDGARRPGAEKLLVGSAGSRDALPGVGRTDRVEPGFVRYNLGRLPEIYRRAAGLFCDAERWTWKMDTKSNCPLQKPVLVESAGMGSEVLRTSRTDLRNNNLKGAEASFRRPPAQAFSRKGRTGRGRRFMDLYGIGEPWRGADARRFWIQGMHWT